MTVPTYDPNYQTKNQRWEGGANDVIAGNLNIDEANGGALYIGGVQQTKVGVPASST